MSSPEEAISEPQLATRTPLHKPFLRNLHAWPSQQTHRHRSLVSGPTNSEVVPLCFGSQCESAENGDPCPSNLPTGGAKHQEPKARQKQVDKERSEGKGPHDSSPGARAAPCCGLCRMVKQVGEPCQTCRLSPANLRVGLEADKPRGMFPQQFPPLSKAGTPQSSSCQLQKSMDADSKAPRGRRDHVSRAAWLWIRRERGRQQGLLHTPLHQTTSQVGKQQGKSAHAPGECGWAGRAGDISKAQCRWGLPGWLQGCHLGTAKGCSMPRTYHLLPLGLRQFPAHGKF